MTDRFEALLDSLEAKNWRWNLDSPDRTMKPVVRKKKFRYTIYMNNGEGMGSPLYVWTMMDGNDLYQLTLDAITDIEKKIVLRQEEIEKERAKKKS